MPTIAWAVIGGVLLSVAAIQTLRWINSLAPGGFAADPIVHLPFWGAVAVAWVHARRAVSFEARQVAECRECGYDMTGLGQVNCPECGAARPCERPASEARRFDGGQLALVVCVEVLVAGVVVGLWTSMGM